ncbi:MAG: Ig-like domain-containing protein [Mangrovibacterium sp.]
MKKLNLLKWIPALFLGLGTMAVSCTEDETSDPVFVLEVAEPTVALDMNTENLTAQIEATTTKDGEAFSENYTYAVAQATIASVSDAGLITALGGGETTVTVTGATTGKTAKVAVTVIGEAAPVATPSYNLDGSLSFSWDATKMTIASMKMLNEAGDVELLEQLYNADGSIVQRGDYVLTEDFTNGYFSLKPGRSGGFNAGSTVIIQAFDGEEETVFDDTYTLHKGMAYTATTSSILFYWEQVSEDSGFSPKTAKVYYRNAPVEEGASYTKGDEVTSVTVTYSDTLSINIEGLESNESYWYEILDDAGEVLYESNSTIPSPITGVKAGISESIWFGDAASAGNKFAECRRIVDRVSIGNGLTYDMITKVEVKDASGKVLVEAEASEIKDNYEYAYITTATPVAFDTFEDALEPSIIYTHKKIDPEDDANGEFNWISICELPYSEESYTIYITADGETYSREYKTAKKADTHNRSQVRAEDVIYADAAAINAKSLEFMAFSTVADDTWEYTVGDAAVATVSTEGIIKFNANGISKVTATSAAGLTQSYEVAAAPSYCNNYSEFQNMTAGTSETLTLYSPSGYEFASATSDDDAVATVDAEGKITAVAEGSTVVTIEDKQGNQSVMTVTVVPASAE